MSVEELRNWNTTKLATTCETVAGSKRVICDKKVNSNTQIAVAIAAGDYVQIKPYPPIRVASVSHNHIVLDNAFPETLPYGTEIYVVYDYKLWDKKHNQACMCDARWTGNDCSLRKCPRGDDPLTVTMTDDGKEGDYYDGTAAGATSSDYNQAVERQTLTIVSDKQIPIGHFSLTFTDFYGDTFTTKPIPTEVQLSCTGRTYLGTALTTPTTTVTFDCEDGLPAHELSEYDYVRIGADYLKVEHPLHASDLSANNRAIEWVDQSTVDNANTATSVEQFTTSKTHIRSFQTVTAAQTGADGTSSRLPHTEGTRIYRQDVSPEIRQALEAIPNNRIEGCSVEAIERTGIQPWPVVNVGDVADVGAVDVKANVYTYVSASKLVKPTFAGTGGSEYSKYLALRTATEKYWSVGDIMRIGDELRRVEAIATTHNADGAGGLTISSAYHAETSTNSPENSDADLKVYKQNMFEYRIKFETGCSHDSHCTANGVDSTDSDQDAWCSAGGICRCSDTSATGYWGYGCTKAGRANHGAPYKRSNSGNLISLKCDKSKLYSGMVIGTPVHVTRSEPLKVVFDRAMAGKDANGGGKFAVGDEIYIDGQVRTVVQVSSDLKVVSVNEPFLNYDKSDAENIIPAHSWAYLLNRDGGTGIRCAATDMPHLKQSQHSCQQHKASAVYETANWPAQAKKAHGPRVLDDSITFANFDWFYGQCEYTESQAWRVDSVDHGLDGGSQTERTIGFHKSTLSQDTNNRPQGLSAIRLLDPHEVHIGDRIRIHTIKSEATGGRFQTRTVDSITRVEGGNGEGKHGLIKYIHVDAPIDETTAANVNADNNGLQVFVDQRGTTENAECSNRGLCDQSTGLCECFKGYTDDDCSRQDALSSGGSA